MHNRLQMSLFNPRVTCISTQRPQDSWAQCSYSLRIPSPEGEGVIKDVNITSTMEV